MKIKPFELERYFSKYEFSVKYLLSSSDCDGLKQSELLSWADPEAKELWDHLTLGYTESLGLPLLRQEIAKLYQNISKDEIITVIPEEGIFIALNSILNKGDHVICTWPGYQSLYQIAESIGCEVSKWEPNEENGWNFDLNSLEKNLKPNTKLLIVNFPHNPTGHLPSKEDFLKIIDFARKNDLYLFSDEMYRFLEFDPNSRLPSACEVYEKAISLFGMSKTFGLAGLRLGWLVIRDKDLLKQVASLKDYTTVCGNTPGEILALIGLRSRDRIIDRHLKRINRNLMLLDDFFKNHAGILEWVRPKAGTIGFAKLIQGDSDKFCKDVVENIGVMLLPSTVYGYDNKHFRIGFGRENMPEALEKVRDYLK